MLSNGETEASILARELAHERAFESPRTIAPERPLGGPPAALGAAGAAQGSPWRPLTDLGKGCYSRQRRSLRGAKRRPRPSPTAASRWTPSTPSSVRARACGELAELELRVRDMPAQRPPDPADPRLLRTLGGQDHRIPGVSVLSHNSKTVDQP
jgi:hypothetical protein